MSLNILVLGGLGFVGANLVRCARTHHGARVTVLDTADLQTELTDRLRPIAKLWSDVEVVRGDMRDAALVAGLVEGRDVIFNCAGQTSHTRSLTDPLLDADINCRGNLTVLEAVRRHAPRTPIVYPSSSTVLGAVSDGVVDERHCERPLDIYSANKSVAEKYYFIYQKVHGLKTVVLRFPNLFGPCGQRSPDFGFINYFIGLAQEGRTITVYGAGAQRRNALFIEDAVDVMFAAAFDERLVGDIYFVAHDQHLSVREIADKIVGAFGRGAVASVEWPDVRRRIEIDSVTISSRRFRRLTGWRPRYDFDAGLRRTRETLEEMEARHCDS